MKRNCKIMFMILAFILMLCIILFIILASYLDEDSRLYRSCVSENMKLSKDNHVFIADYSFYPKVIEFDNKPYTIKEIWIEKRWMYKDEKIHKSIIFRKTKTEDLTVVVTGGEQVVFSFIPNLTNGNVRVEYNDISNNQYSNGSITDNLNITLPENEINKDTIYLSLFNKKDNNNILLSKLKMVRRK